ncbi:hypothetical protein SFUMM280S_00999 [Streptomyces fumanus]
MELTRRTFSAVAGTTVLGLVLGGGSSGAVAPSGAGRVVPTGPPPPPPAADGTATEVRADRYSLLVDGRRLVLWSGELQMFRLPSPSLWRDALEKMRAHGYNAVEVPLAWHQHSRPGRYDFTGVRDLGLFLRTAAAAGLYVVLRPGARIGAGVDAGGLPGWLAGIAPADRRRHEREWLRGVHEIAGRHLYTSGQGTVLLYRLTEPRWREQVRADGIDVPLVDGDTGVPRPKDAAEERRRRLDDLAGGSVTPRGRWRSAGCPGGGSARRRCPPRTTRGPRSTGGARRPGGWRRCTRSGSCCGTCPTCPSWSRRRGCGPGTGGWRCGTWPTWTPAPGCTCCATTPTRT